MGQRPTFRDRALDRRFEELGYVVVPGAARDVVDPLVAVHRRLVGDAPTGFHSTPYTDDAELKRAVDREIRGALGPVVDPLLEDWRGILGSFISKRRGEDSGMPPHMDWTFVDEPELASVNVWVPLVDVGRRNGAMSVLPRSHRVPFTIRGTGTDNPYSEVEEVAAARMVRLDMRAGDVLLHDHRVLHSSPPNRSRRPRLVAGMAVVPRGARAVHYRQAPDGTMVRHVLDDRFFTDHTYGADDLPPSAVVDGVVRFSNPSFEPSDLPVADRAGVP